nr:uncharacterized protein LOC109715806 isoform X1 [Ipomoea trifida]
MLTKDAEDGLRFPVLESDSPFPKNTIDKSLTPTEKGNSCLFLRMCVRVAAVGLFMVNSPPKAEVLVLPSTDLSSSARVEKLSGGTVEALNVGGSLDQFATSHLRDFD